MNEKDGCSSPDRARPGSPWPAASSTPHKPARVSTRASRCAALTVIVVVSAGATMSCSNSVVDDRASIRFPGCRVAAVSITPDGRAAYIANRDQGNVVVIDTSTNEIDATITVGHDVQDVAVTATGTTAYVSGNGGSSNADSGYVAAINTSDNTVIATIQVGGMPESIAATPDGGTVLAADLSNSELVVIDAKANAVVDRIAIPHGARSVGVRPDGAYAYVTGWYGSQSTVSIVDTSTWTISSTFEIQAEEGADAEVIDVAFTPDGRTAYFGSNGIGDSSVWAIDTQSLQQVATIAAGGLPESLTVSKDGKYLYVANLSGDNISAVDTATNEVIRSIPVGDGPTDIAVTHDGGTAYVTYLNSDEACGEATVSQISLRE